MKCPCLSGVAFNKCCEPIIKEHKQAETAEQLMRARYTAHTQVMMDFVEKTHDPKTRRKVDMQSNREWAETTKWLGLEIIKTERGGVDDTVGTVEFKAMYESDEGPTPHHELSQFIKRNGAWYYTDSKDPSHQSVVRREPKIGRNDPCTCGSGKKYKKCCEIS